MIKRTILFLFILFSISTLSFADFNDISLLNKIEIENYYNSNILRLSSKNISQFKKSLNPDKFHINSVDDFILSIRYELGVKHTYFRGHTQIDRIIFKYKKYWNNGIKNYYYFGAEVKQYFSKYFNISIKYLYFPDFYVNHYKSVLDNENVYREFSYAKNLYRSTTNWRIRKWLKSTYQFEYEQLYYNKYFPEYDANNLVNALMFTFSSNKRLCVKFKYAYKISSAKAEKAFENLTEDYKIKDASYESNIYSYDLSTPIRLNVLPEALKLSCNSEFEERFFQSEQPFDADPYHVGRKDKILGFGCNLRYPISKVLNLKVFYQYENRDTISPAGSFVEDAKQYSRYKLGTVFNWKFNL